MSNGEDSAVSKLCADGLLDEVVSLQVHSCRRLVQHQDLGLAQQSSRQTHQLTLPDTGMMMTGKRDNDAGLLILSGGSG